MMVKINIHSIVDVITNSSTVIYTYQDSVSEAKELLQEILILIGEKKKVDDLFYLGVFCESDIYSDRLGKAEDNWPNDLAENWDYKQRGEYVDQTITKVLRGEVPRPQWMIDVDNKENYSGFNYSTDLCIVARDEKYQPLVAKIMKFLNSPEHESCYDG